MLEKVKAHYQRRYEVTKKEAKNATANGEAFRIVWCAIQRNAGVAEFFLDNGYEGEFEELHNEYREKLLELLK